MYILGISGFLHDSAACLLKDGEIIAAIEEERLSRIKHASGLPVNAIEYCLNTAKIQLNQIDHISYYLDHKKIITVNIKDSLVLRRSLFNAIKSVAFSLYILASLEVAKLWLADKLRAPLPKFKVVIHHLAHAASAFFVSPFKSSAILILDLMGEAAATSLLIGEGNKIHSLKEINYPNSIGLLYASITDYLGFKVASDEYKVMGLASYGRLDSFQEFRELIKLLPHGEYQVDLSYFNFHLTGRAINSTSKKFIKIFGPPRKPEEPIQQRHKDIAACLQKATEDTVLHLVNNLYDVTKNDNLCIAGGVGLNSVINGKILRQSKFKQLFIQPSAHDAGCAIGGAYYIYNQLLGYPRDYVMEHDYFGPDYSDEMILEDLTNSKVRYSYFPDIERVTAKLIAEGKIIGWFQGKMEFGPRALGNRSILADPTRKDMMDIVNKWVKHREDFRPFAPAVLEEEAKDYFEIDYPSPFMLNVVPVKSAKRAKIPAVTHIDGSARVQTVSKSTNPKFWHLINEFKALTGTPVVLNTSFNVRGEPIVCTPKDALRCFFSTGIDCLVMGNYLIEK